MFNLFNKDRKWKFPIPKNTVAITVRQITDGDESILLACNDPDGWQFIGSSDAREEDAMVVVMSTIVDLDRTIEDLSDLPVGWVATRQSKKHKWIRSQRDTED